MRVLHLHSSFDLGGKERRAVQLMNAFGRGIEFRCDAGQQLEHPHRLRQRAVEQHIVRRFLTPFPLLRAPYEGRDREQRIVGQGKRPCFGLGELHAASLAHGRARGLAFERHERTPNAVTAETAIPPRV